MVLIFNKLPRARELPNLHPGTRRAEKGSGLRALHLRGSKSTTCLMTWWPLLLFAVHSHRWTTSWCFLSQVPPTAHPLSRGKNHMTTKGLRPRPYSYSAQGPIRERTGKEGYEHLLGSFNVPGRVPNSSTARELGPQSVSDWAPLALSLHLKSFILISCMFLFV